ncbi:MAG: alpha/beta hydrolase fold domain-containing protein [Caldimonas sp.]
MRLLRDGLGRTMLFPALHLMRAEMKLMADPILLRKMAARVDALGSQLDDVRTEPVAAGDVPAAWVDVKGVPHDRVVLYLHGGAFVAETPVFHGALLARICRAARARGLMPSYRLSPEHRYPAALDDCMAAYRWLLEQGHDPSRIVVAGDSAGGNLTLALLLRLRDEGLPLPAGAVALSPVADLTFSGDSIQRNDGVDDMFSADMMDAMVPVYLAQRNLCTDPHVSPVFGDYAGMPPLLLIVGSSELLLDDSVRVAHRCPSAQLLVWNGMPHVFPGFDFLPEAREATQRIGRFVRECTAGETEPPVPTHEEAGRGKAAPVRPARPAGRSAPRRLGVEALTYLTLAVLTGSISLAVFAIWLGPALLLANPVVWAATVVSAVFMFIEAGSVGWRRLPWCFAATLLLGPGCGLSVFLFLRASRGAGSRTA